MSTFRCRQCGEPVSSAADGERLPGTDRIARAAGIALALIALATMLLPWGRGKPPFYDDGDDWPPAGTVEQTGLQMLYGGATFRDDNGKAGALPPARMYMFPFGYAPGLIVGFPACLLLALGSLLLAERNTRWRW